jgi:uncharacterized membrane protein
MPMNQRNIIITVAVVALLGVAGGAYLLRSGGADISEAPPAEDRQQATKYVASEEFSKLDEETRKDYVKKFVGTMGGGPPRGLRATTQLSDEERSRFRQQFGPVMRQMMTKRINDYFALPADEQVEHLDKIIDMFEARRAEAAKDDSGRPRRGMTPERLKNILENTKPEMRAKFVEFRKALENRSKQRGLPSAFGPPK